MKANVAIIGGGPAGSTVGTFLKKYNPSLDVVIVERERFPRDHVGESHLPAISTILAEMGVWEKVEAANFPIKIGATFKWGSTDDHWFTDFLQYKEFQEEPRPAKYEGQRTETAFQVDRSIYDQVLLDHAREMGCQVFEETKVLSIDRDGDRVLGLNLESGERLEADYYVDSSGDSGVLRRAMEIEIEAPTALRNIAIYKYWNDARWAATIGRSGTRVQIMSLGWGWLWFIPITSKRTSVGLVLPAHKYKASGKTTEQLYFDAIAEEPMISKLLASAEQEPELNATKDWNFLSKRLAGENWFLAGDSCGFADPILSAGMTLAHTSARKVAFTLLELFRGDKDPAWLKFEYEDGHRAQIRHHMQFADFWYSANGRFTDLQDYCTEIAEKSGITLDGASAFRWLATGGFAIDEPGVPAALTYRVAGLKQIAVQLGGSAPEWELTKTNHWRLNMIDAKHDTFVRYRDGQVISVPCIRRGPKILPLVDAFKHVVSAFDGREDCVPILEYCVNAMIRDGIHPAEAQQLAIEAIESLMLEGWVKTRIVTGRPYIKVAESQGARTLVPPV